MKEMDLANGIIWYGVFLYSTVCHEAAHAWASHRLGDDTAYNGGQVSLDPTPHIRREPIGMVIMPVISFWATGWPFGWASAPYDPDWARRYPQRSAWMAVAGPAANILIALVAAILMIIGVKAGVFEQAGFRYFSDPIVTSSASEFWSGMGTFLGVAFKLNTMLAVLNLIPLPPLDGSAIPLFFLRGSASESYQEFCSQPAMQMIGLLVIFKGFWIIFIPIFSPIMKLLTGFM